MSLDVSLLEKHPQLKLFYEFEELLFNISEDNIEQIEKKIDEFPQGYYNCLRIYLSESSSKLIFKLNLLERLWCYMGTTHYHLVMFSILIDYLGKKDIIDSYLLPPNGGWNYLSWENMLNLFPNDSLGGIIRNDDIDNFLVLSYEPRFYESVLIYPDLDLYYDMTLLGFAGFCGSTKIFKFILINDQIEWKPYIKDIANYVIKGGNKEIVAICSLLDFPFSYKHLTVALKAHNNNIAQWILNNYGYGDLGMADIIRTFNVLGIAFAMENFLDLTKLDYRNQTPLMAASSIGYCYIVEWLLENPASEVNIFEPVRFLSKALSRAAFHGHLELVNYLIDKGADVNMATNFDMLPLIAACLMGHEKCVESIIVKGHASYQTENDYSPLILAVQRRNIEVVQYLLSLEPKLDINKKDIQGKSPLHYASLQSIFSLVELLVDNGADVNAYDYDGNTPIHLATYSTSTRSASYLIDHGADVNAENNSDQRPLDLAYQNNNETMIQFLESEGATRLINAE